MDDVARAFDCNRVAVLTIDLHRGHLDPDIATLPLSRQASARVVANNVGFLKEAREVGVPVVHAVTRYREAGEIEINRFWRAIANTGGTRSNVLHHNIEGGPGTLLMPEIYADGDRIVDTKKRYDCFLGTDLDFVLRRLAVETLFITGVNTNSCVLATTIAASVRDFACVVITDCVDTVDGVEFHEYALSCIRRAFGWVKTSAEALQLLRAAEAV